MKDAYLVIFFFDVYEVDVKVIDPQTWDWIHADPGEWPEDEPVKKWFGLKTVYEPVRYKEDTSIPDSIKQRLFDPKNGHLYNLDPDDKIWINRTEWFDQKAHYAPVYNDDVDLTKYGSFTDVVKFIEDIKTKFNIIDTIERPGY